MNARKAGILRYLNLIHGSKRDLAIRTDGGIITLGMLRGLTGSRYANARSTDDVIRRPKVAEKIVSDFVKHRNRLEKESLQESEVKFLPCVIKPGKIVCVGLNYRKHAQEIGVPLPQFPVIFSKFSESVAAHLQSIPIAAEGWNVDYEAELGLVIGCGARRIAAGDALNAVFGYFAANDVSAREPQMRTSQWLLGKTSVNFAPIGPYIVTPDETGRPDRLRIRCSVNGEVRQDSSTSDMIFGCDYIISYVSQYFPLYPGDIILTGTPEGVILGSRGRRKWISPGDTVEVEIERLGTLRNTFIDEAEVSTLPSPL
ncbi:MAG: fumarylacetoacetate hydrolase family protein [Methanomassiliicoccales archaeon]|nr:fumarylacetoacetate hydrolase family protein [Methanomassiliicoccales archaeon]